MRLLQLVIADLRGLLAVQCLLLGLTMALTGYDVGDLRVHVAWGIFLLPGWWWSATWTGRHSGLVTRYAHAVIGSIAIHASLAAIVYLLGLGFTAYFFGLAAVMVVTAAAWGIRLKKWNAQNPIGLTISDAGLWLAVMVLVVVIYREPRSADIIQFSLQQQDMALTESLQPSAIGMTALGVDTPMPRWRAHLWHVAASLMSEASSSSVIQLLRRWAPIPLAFAVISSLIHVTRSLVGRSVPLWAVVLAVFGPVVLWYRSYNAFTYSFRLTNNFWLDKDLCLFFLIPVTVYLAVGWLRGMRCFAWPLVLLVPAIVKFHPMTAVYLVLLLPFFIIGYGDVQIRSAFAWPAIHRKVYWLCAWAIGLFVAVVWIGDAQGSHRYIDLVVSLDFDDFQTGRPLHYWVGHYGAIKEHPFDLDTTAWTDGNLHLRARVLFNCGLLSAAYLAWLVWLLALIRERSRPVRRDQRLWLAVTICWLMIWGAWLVSPAALGRYPHFLGGYERLHWFVYLPALIAVTRTCTLIDGACRRMIGQGEVKERESSVTWSWNAVVALLLLYSAGCYWAERPTILTNIRGLNSLLDFELSEHAKGSYVSRAIEQPESVVPRRPDYLRPSDRVLFLENSGNDRFWLMKQGAFWSEPYAEAYALERRGEGFLRDRSFFYAMLDRLEVEQPKAWLQERGVTLVIDRRDGGDQFLAKLNRDHNLQMQRVQPGVWRTPATSN